MLLIPDNLIGFWSKFGTYFDICCLDCVSEATLHEKKRIAIRQILSPRFS